MTVSSQKKKIFYVSLIEDPINNGIINSQVVNVLKAAVAAGHEATLFCSPSKKLFSRHSRQEIDDFRNHLEQQGIKFYCIPIPVISNACIRALLIPFFIAFEFPVVLYHLLKVNPDIIHCRSYPASLIGMLIKKITGKKLVFDMRGVYPEEGNFLFKNWPVSGINFKLWKFIEIILIRSADTVVVVSDHFKEYVEKNFHSRKVSVIYCAPELTVSNTIKKTKDHRIKLVYSGTIDGWTTPELLARTYFDLITENEATPLFLNIYTATDPQKIITAFNDQKLDKNSYSIKKLTAKQVFVELCKNDIGLLIREDSIVNQVSFPVKLGEYISAELPVIINKNLLGVKSFIEKNQVGATLEDKNSIKQLFSNIEEFRSNCHIAKNILVKSGQSYIDLYKNL